MAVFLQCRGRKSSSCINMKIQWLFECSTYCMFAWNTCIKTSIFKWCIIHINYIKLSQIIWLWLMFKNCYICHSTLRIQHFLMYWAQHALIANMCKTSKLWNDLSNSISFPEIASQMFPAWENWNSPASITLSLHKRCMSLLTPPGTVTISLSGPFFASCI